MAANKISEKQSIINCNLWLPKAIIVDILAKLPDKSLMRFKSVCKTWLSMISDPKLMVNNTHKLILWSSTSIQVLEYGEYKGNAKALHFEPPNNIGKCFKVLGSCNGLLCIVVGSKDLYLWNPITGEYKKPPPFEYMPPEPLGFGYDHFTDDYKIVHYPQPRYIFSGLPPAKTYSLRTDCWISRIDEEVLNPYSGVIHLCEPEAGTLVNNALYWHAAYKHRNLKTFDDSCVICPHDDEEFGKTEDACSVIFRFSLVDEKELLLLPPPAIEFAGVFELIDFKGCLCISELDSDRYYINMWVLMEDDVNAATKFNWMKLMRIPCLDTMLAPIYFMRNGEVLLNVREHSADSLCNGFRQCRFYSYNPTEETVTEVCVQCIKDWSSEIKYSETQVSLH